MSKSIEWCVLFVFCCPHQATLRCFPFDQPAGPHTCLMTGKPAAEVAIFAKSY